MAVLEFKSYSVNELSYKKNDLYQGTRQNINIDPEIKINNTLAQDSIIVTVNVQIGSQTDKQAPFMVIASISGEFVYYENEDHNQAGVDTLIKKNAVAILYPYVRSLVSNITNASNQFPALILPTINVTQVLDENGKSPTAAD